MNMTTCPDKPQASTAAHSGLPLAEAHLAGILAIADDAIISIDEAQLVTVFSDGAEKIFGYTKAEVVGQSLDVLIPGRFRLAHGSHARAFSHGSNSSRRMAERQAIYGLRKDGTEFPAEASISKISVGEQRIFTVILRDVTDARRQQDELETRVLERTQALQDEIRQRETAQAALVQAQRMDALGQLAAVSRMTATTCSLSSRAIWRWSRTNSAPTLP